MGQTVHWGNQALSPPTLGEHRRSIRKNGHFPNPAPGSEHFNQADDSINDVLLIPPRTNPVRNNRDSVRKTSEAHLIDKAKTLEPHCKNKRDLLPSVILVTFIILVAYHFLFAMYSNLGYVTLIFLSVFIFLS